MRVKNGRFFFSNSIRERFGQWQQVFAMGEIGAVFFLPKTDRIYRINQFSQWQSDSDIDQAAIVDLIAGRIEEPEDFLRLTDNHKSFAIYPAEILLEADRQQLFDWLIDLHVNRRFSFLLLFEMLPCEYERDKFVQYHPSLLQNIFFFPLYTEKEVARFIAYLEHKWRAEIAEEITKRIYGETGGYLWLVKEILRQSLSDKKSWDSILGSSSYRRKAYSIWERFPAPAKARLFSISGGRGTGQDEYAKIFTDFNLINGRFVNKVPNFIYQIAQVESCQELQIKAGKVIFRDRDLSARFSDRERAILSLFNKARGRIVDREEIARIYWGRKWNERYSDWAIDQSISRLRTKLQAFNIPKRIITIRGEGYEFS